MAGFADLMRIRPWLNVIDLPRFDGYGRRTAYWVFEQRPEERFALFQVRLQLGKGSKCHALPVPVSEEWEQPRMRQQQSALKDALI